MQLTEIRINLCPGTHGTPNSAAGQGMTNRLRAFCSVTFDNTFVVRDIKLIEGNGGLFLAMPSRKLSDHCPGCGEKNHLRARFCNACGRRLNEDRALRPMGGLHGRSGASSPVPNGQNKFLGSRPKLHADIAHPINAESRRRIEEHVLAAYWHEVEQSRKPGYVPPSLDAEDYETYDPAPIQDPGPAVPAAPAAFTEYRTACNQ